MLLLWVGVMDDGAWYVKIRIRKQIKNKKKLYRASLLTKDKKEKVIGWFVTRAEATNIANITRDRHEKIRLLRAEAMSTTNVNGNVQPKNDIIIINNEATKKQQISNEENSKQIMARNKKHSNSLRRRTENEIWVRQVLLVTLAWFWWQAEDM